MNRPRPLRAYKQAEATRSGNERDQEIVRHLPLVHSVVERLAAHLPEHVDRDDLFHAGVIGLIDAIDRFDPGRDNAFSTYAVLRIRGAIIDELRARDWVPRSARARAREYQQVLYDLSCELDRVPEDQEVADRLGVPIEDLPDLEKGASLASQISLDAPVGEDGSLAAVLTQSEPEADDPTRNLEHEDRRRLLLRILAGLKEQERRILKMYYFEGMLMKEIAEVLGVTESRICQIHGRLLTVLRGRLALAGLTS